MEQLVNRVITTVSAQMISDVGKEEAEEALRTLEVSVNNPPVLPSAHGQPVKPLSTQSGDSSPMSPDDEFQIFQTDPFFRSEGRLPELMSASPKPIRETLSGESSGSDEESNYQSDEEEISISSSGTMRNKSLAKSPPQKSKPVFLARSMSQDFCPEAQQKETSSIRPQSMFYSVDQEVLDYLNGDSSVKPEDLSSTLNKWEQDCWNHLISPPSELKPAHYLACLTSLSPNSLKRTKFIQAQANLEMARATDPSLSLDKLFKRGNKLVKEIQYTSGIGEDVLYYASLYEESLLQIKHHLVSIEATKRVSTELVQSVRDMMGGEIKTFNNNLEKLLGEFEIIVKRLGDPLSVKSQSLIVQQSHIEETKSPTPSVTLSSSQSSVSSLHSVERVPSTYYRKGIIRPRTPSP